MEPDVDPLFLPLQGPRVRPSRSGGTRTTRDTRNHATATPKTTTNATRQPARPVQQPSSKRGDVSRLPAAAKSGTRVATGSRRPPPSSHVAKRSVDRSATTSGPANPPSRSTRDTPATRRGLPKPPSSERTNQAQEPGLTRAGTVSDTERWDLTPEGGSAGREGRQFTVSNVGNNGRIYLR